MPTPTSDLTTSSTTLPGSSPRRTSEPGPDLEGSVPVRHATSSHELRRFRDYTYWSLVGVSALLLLLFATTGSVPYPPDPAGIALFGGLAVVIVAIARLAEQHVPRQPRERPLSRRAWWSWAMVGTAAAALVATIWAVNGEAWLWALAPAAVVSLLIADQPKARRRVAIVPLVLAAGALGAAIGAVRGEPVEGYVFGPMILVACWLSITLASVWTWDVVVQLDEARRTASSLAVANERLRFASDLHDIQGHSLQVIALKSELASRLVAEDPATAAAEMDAVRELAADALRDTRSVVEGYRRTRLDTEIANASNVLGSVGLDARLHLDAALEVTALPRRVQHLLGLVVREAVTNVLRHSAATEADIELRADGEAGDAGRVRLTVSNDGAAEVPPGRSGGGLTQLAGRLHEAGGELTWERRDDRFEVHADLPVAAAGEAPDVGEQNADRPDGTATEAPDGEGPP